MADSTNAPSSSSPASEAQSTSSPNIHPSSSIPNLWSSTSKRPFLALRTSASSPITRPSSFATFAPAVRSPLCNVRTIISDTESDDTETKDNPSGDNPSDDGQSDDNQIEDNQKDDNQSYGNQNDNQSDDNQSDDTKSNGNHSDDNQTNDTQTDDKQVLLQPPSFRHRTLGPKITYVKLTSGQVFTAHTDLLRYWSPKLCDVLEDGVNVLHLDGNSKVAGIFLEWIYTGRLHTLDVETYQYDPAMEDQSKRPDLVGKDGELKSTGWYYLTSLGSVALDLYVFATDCDIRQLRNDIIGEMHKIYNPQKVPLYSIIHRAYTNLPPDSPILHFLRDLFSARFRTGMDDGAEAVWRSKVPDAFFLDVVNGPDTETINICDYHEHIDIKEKMSCPANIEEVAAPDIEYQLENCSVNKEEDAAEKTEAN